MNRESNDVKELIPEFFYLPEFLRNENAFDLGTQSDKKDKVDDVTLPPWAENSAEKFVRINRKALESDIVSEKLNQWIDLIFGFKQKGENAIANCNVFYHLTYENAVDIDSIKDSVDKNAIQEQIKHFGQTPCQLLTEPHPKRPLKHEIKSLQEKTASETTPTPNSMQSDVLMVLKFVSNSPICYVSANTHPALDTPAISTVTRNQLFGINRWRQDEIDRIREEQANTKKSLPVPEFPIDEDELAKKCSVSRQIPELLDQSHKLDKNTFLVAADNNFILVCGFWDRSFRVYRVVFLKCRI